MNKAKRFLAGRKKRADDRLITIGQFQAEARDEMLEMNELIAQVKETITSLENVIRANTATV